MNTDFHTFTLIRTEQEIVWLIDGEKANRCESNRCDQCLPGGIYPTGSMNVIVSVGVDNDPLPTESTGITEVEYVKIWNEVPTCNLFSADDKTINNRTFSNDHEKFISSSITTQNSVIIKDGSVAHWTAGEFIELNPGFEVEEGADFIAEIIPCRPPDDIFCKTGSTHDSTSNPVSDTINVVIDSLYTIQNINHFTKDNNNTTVQNNFNQLISVFPNPNQGIFQLAVHDYGYALANVIITNLLGQVVYQQANINFKNPVKINISSQPKGIYFMKVSSKDEGQNLFIQKIILQ